MRLTEAREKAIQVYENANIFTVKAIRDGIKPLLDITDTEVVEVKRGKWFKAQRKNIWGESTAVLECSACGKYAVGKKGITRKSKYCPNCGALMQEDNMDEWEKVLKRMKKNEKYLEGELFNLDDTLTAFILPRLKGFRDATIGYPPYLGSLENWQSELDKMIKAFQILYDCERLNTLSDSDEEAIEIGLKSFAEYYNHLWY